MKGVFYCYIEARFSSIDRLTESITTMALIATSLIWVAYAVCLAILFFVAGIFVFVYQKPHDRGLVVTLV